MARSLPHCAISFLALTEQEPMHSSRRLALFQTKSFHVSQVYTLFQNFDLLLWSFDWDYQWFFRWLKLGSTFSRRKLSIPSVASWQSCSAPSFHGRRREERLGPGVKCLTLPVWQERGVGGDNVGKGRVENSTNGVSRSLSKGGSCIMSGMIRARLCPHFIHPKVISICI